MHFVVVFMFTGIPVVFMSNSKCQLTFPRKEKLAMSYNVKDWYQYDSEVVRTNHSIRFITHRHAVKQQTLK